jgi:LmbE family N-acetylglucosaminyl deacetylase
MQVKRSLQPSTLISMVRIQSRKVLWNVLKFLSCQIRDEDLAKPAIIFSPHQDDETLGCGGTIILKKRAGANVKVVFLTDGSSSHRQFVSEQKLKTMRAQEALSACNVLGLERRDVIFLEFRDQYLKESQEEAEQEVKAILVREACEEVFIPYSWETISDHRVTNTIVLSAIKALQKKVVIYEYPIWFWQHWPWATISVSNYKDALIQMKSSLLSWLSLAKNFRCSVPIGEVLELKRLALNQHRSQMERLGANSQWLILSDISDGEFLLCFFQESELFYRHPPC